ncbi:MULTISPECIES: HD domain-containing protein [unclassified Gemella]|uniref:HD domain-containing protein n=1 Tax=unclassified Gemella TaxID=2624949 RepID=UPI00107455BD|nr:MULTISPECIES: HD domain-containing protein [unclassified Gemella]MBF0710494.1 HD domain-containing protein [Gemella sp. GL1.1]MBF0746565.1 HD domain-containing protein [Gemella sp. 19428wG2_WT2a]NYS27838.1 HD domain-containing protein [Gemella sp. GL1]TFU59925.1 HD domain-containing protein [Gemella sp. WT2a]
MVLERLTERKVIRDPIHGYINIEYKVIWEAIDSKEFQRLRRIKQLGGDFQVYPSAEHTRFTHSLGVYEIVRRMVTEIASLSEELSEKDKVAVMLAGLLHDVGHGPFSHAFEQVTGINHEDYTAKIILGNTEINAILSKVSRTLAKEVVSIIQHKHVNDLLNQIVSAQLDADRMDYLLRDSYYSATSYGQFDLERILRTLRVREHDDGKKYLVIKESGIHSVEDYIMARYQMYWQVYYHPVARAYEALFIKFFSRLKDIHKENKSFFKDLPYLLPFLENKEIDEEEYFRLDEAALQYYWNIIQHKNDEIAADLASRLINRDLFEYEDYTEEKFEKLKKELVEKGYDPTYYLRKESITASTYSPFTGQKILIIRKDGTILELEKASTIVNSISKGEIKKEGTIFFPKI